MSKLIDYIRETWHEVPDAVTIPDGVEFAVVRHDEGVFTPAAHADGFYRVSGRSYTRFTPEPLPVEPDFELPTTPGALIIACDTEYPTRRMFMRTVGGRWYNAEGFYCDDEILDPQPAIAVPTETWDRLRVLDPEDERNRVDRDGDLVRFTTQSKEVWGEELAARNWRYGPLRFADEVTDHE